MPLFDHFRPPLQPLRKWESFHSRWANSIADALMLRLPAPRYFTEVQVHLGATVEADVMVTPAIVSLGVMKPGEAKQFKVVIKGKHPFQIDKIECDSEAGLFKVRVPKNAAQVHVLPMTVTAPEKPGNIQEEFIVTVNGRPQPVTFKAMGKIAEPAGS